MKAASPLRQAVARRPLIIFFTLAYLLSWYPWFIALARGDRTGPNPLGPFVAALIVLGIASGWPGVRDLFSRIGRWRVGLSWYLFIFAFPVVVCALAALTTSLLTGAPLSLPSPDKLRESPERFLFILLFIGLGEEPGWRGFALPQLQKRYSPLIASCILAPLWAIWHLPLFGLEFALPIVPAFLISLVGGTFIQTWLFNRTDGSVLLQMLFHAAVNTIGAGLVFSLFTGSALIVFWYVYSFMWLATGVALLRTPAVASSRLTRASCAAS